MFDFLGFKILTSTELAELQKPKEPMYIHDIVLNRAPIEKSYTGMPKETINKLKETSDKYPAVHVTYAGTPKKGSAVYPIDVKNYAACGQNDDALIQFLKEKKLTVDGRIVSKLTYHELCDEIVAKINQATPVNYAFDIDNYGFSEYWQFAPLTFKTSIGDCDDYAILRYVLYRLAGVPAELIRIGVGLTSNGQGHATIYYLSSSLEWLHLNSTTTFVQKEDTIEKQTRRDSDLEIQDFWFSFNELGAWSKIDSKDALLDMKLHDKFKIESKTTPSKR